MKASEFDFLAYLDDKNVHYDYTGSNVSQGWVGTQCIFCGDHSNHLGINLNSKHFSCFRCGVKNGPAEYIMELEGCSLGRALSIMREYPEDPLARQEIKRELLESKVQLPKGSTQNLPGVFRDYLLGRSFDPDHLIKDFHIHAGGYIGKFALRIVIPIIMKGELVSYTGRDITDTAELRYRNAAIEDSRIAVKNCTYNVDSVKDVAVYVEGPTDVWRGGDGFVCTFGTQFTSSHVIAARRLKKAFVLYDPEADNEAERLCHSLSCVVPSIEKITLSDGDPGSMTEKEIFELRRDIGI